MIYFEQAGALNESLSDMFGSLVKQFSKKQRVCHALEQAMPLGEPEEKAPEVGRGDQRYFRIQIQ